MKNDLIQSFASQLVNSNHGYLQQWRFKALFGYRFVEEPVTMELFRKHFEGSITVALPSLDKNGHCRWCAWDSDHDDGRLAKIEQVVSGLGLHGLVDARREGREGHLWLFFDQTLPATDLRRFNDEVMAHAGLPPDALEFFPKQSSVDKVGSCLRVPLGIHRKPDAGDRRSLFENCNAIDVDSQLLWFTQQQLNSAKHVMRLASYLRHLDKQRDRSKLVRPILKRRFSSKRFNVLDVVSDRRRVGNGWVAQCPLCAMEGHDRSKDNLRITLDGSKFCCVYGGPNNVHTVRDLIRAFFI